MGILKNIVERVGLINSTTPGDPSLKDEAAEASKLDEGKQI